MATASIESSVTAPVAKPSVINASRDDLEINDVVLLDSVNAGTVYSWTIAFAPEGSTASFSGSAVAKSPGSFTVDVEGPYLIRLVFTDGTGSTEQFVRLRALTSLGDLKLVAAGEGVYAVPVPVDGTAAGWADDQNGNLLSLLSLITKAGSGGRLLYVDPAQGDYQTIQEALDYAQTQTPTAIAPWAVLVRPGTYTEDLTFYSHIHVFGAPGGGETKVVRIQNDTAAHSVFLAGSLDEVNLTNLYFENPDTSANAVLSLSGAGTLTLSQCVVSAEGGASPQGPAILTAGTSALRVRGGILSSNSGASADSYALIVGDGTTASLWNATVDIRGIHARAGSTLELRDCSIASSGSYGIRSEADFLDVELTKISGAATQDIAFNPGGGAVTGDVVSVIRWSRFGALLYDTAGISGTTSLTMGSVDHGALSFPSGNPGVLAATVLSSTQFFDNTATGLAAENVQAAIDEVWGVAVAVRTLDDAYDGGGSPGSGRRIVADQGAVEIVDAAAPSDPIPPGSTDGGLDIVGRFRLGAINKPELQLSPNPYGNGPEVLMGQEIWAPDAPFGSTAFLLANATGVPSHHNYNIRVGSKSAAGGNQVGRAILRGGDSLANPLPAGSVYVQAGRGAAAGGGDGASLYLVPGDSEAGSVGDVVLVRPEAATPATLQASGAFVGGVTGTVRFGTDMGAVEVAIDAADNLFAVLGKLNATLEIVASDAGGGVILLTTASRGETAEVFFLNADTGLDVALGGFASQTMTAGTFPEAVRIRVTAANEITFGVGDANPMIYNTDTGKLTVPGPLDPTYLIQTEAPPTAFISGKGVLWVGDGAGGSVLGDLYYIHEHGTSSATAMNLTGGLGSITVEDEGTGLGAFKILNFTGSGVTVTDAGGGQANVVVTGGGGGGGSLVGAAQDVFAATDFAWDGSVSSVTLSSIPDSNVMNAGIIVLFRNGVSDINNVGPTAPTTEFEYRIVSNVLEIGADVTLDPTDTYRIVYPIISAAILAGIQQDLFPSASFTWDGTVSSVAITETLDTAADLAGFVILYKNGIAEVDNVGPAVPTNEYEYRINAGNLEIGDDITIETHNYRLVYPKT